MAAGAAYSSGVEMASVMLQGLSMIRERYCEGAIGPKGAYKYLAQKAHRPNKYRFLSKHFKHAKTFNTSLLLILMPKASQAKSKNTCD